MLPYQNKNLSVLGYVSFDNHKPGEAYDVLDVVRDFGTMKSLGTLIPNNRVKVILRDDEPGNAIEVKYPKDELRSLNSGASWFWQNFGQHRDLYLSYWVKFPLNFDFRAGGKLHGLCGGDCNTGGNKPNGHDGWSSRIHWSKDGKLKQYIYHKDQKGDYGQVIFWTHQPEPILFNSEKIPRKNDKRIISVKKGIWHYIITRVVVNDIGQRNGLVQSWFDGEVVLNVHGFEFRDAACAENDLLINRMYFSTFFGGDDDTYKPVKDEYAYFDDFLISKELYCPPNITCEKPENCLILQKPQSIRFDTSVPGAACKYGYGMRLDWITPAGLNPAYYEIQYATDLNPVKPVWATYHAKLDSRHGPWINHHGHECCGDFGRCLPSDQTFYYRVRALNAKQKPITIWSNITSATVPNYIKKED